MIRRSAIIPGAAAMPGGYGAQINMMFAASPAEDKATRKVYAAQTPQNGRRTNPTKGTRAPDIQNTKTGQVTKCSMQAQPPLGGGPKK
jgi:hypothetical protein